MKKDSPLNNLTPQEKIDFVKEEFGEEAAEKAKEEELMEKNIDLEEMENEDLIGNEKQDLDFKFLLQTTKSVEHLEGFEYMDRDLGLHGEDYLALKKALYYVQNSLRQDNVQYKINNNTRVDNRPHTLILTRAGQGKSTIKNQIKRVMKNYMGLDGCIEVAGVSHPEQLVGKIVYKGRGDTKKRVEKRGLLGYKCLLNDESQDMLNEKNDILGKSQRIKRIGMDSFGENEISKKLVDDSPEDTLSYKSPTRIIDFAHPVKLESRFFDTGSFRRYNAFLIDDDENIDLKSITNFKFETDEHNKDWVDFLDSNYKKHVNVVFNEETLEIIEHYHKSLLLYLLNHKNANVLRYGLLTRYSLRSSFCKNVIILAKTKGESKPSLNTIFCACADTILFILKSIETYNTLGNIGSTSDVWGGVSEEDAQALEYLYRKKALSREGSEVSVKKFMGILGKLYGCKITQSRKYHYNLKKNGFIGSKQKGQYDSCVWLKYIPKEIKLINKEYDSLGFYDKYFQGSTAKSTFYSTLKSMFTDDKSYLEYQGVGGIGVLGCLLYIYSIRVKPHTNKINNIYIYNTRGVTDTLGTLNQIPQKPPISKVEKVSQGIKTPKTRPIPSNPKSNRDTPYWEDDITKNIQGCDEEEIISYMKKHPKTKINELLKKFGPGVMKFKKEGIIK